MGVSVIVICVVAEFTSGTINGSIWFTLIDMDDVMTEHQFSNPLLFLITVIRADELPRQWSLRPLDSSSSLHIGWVLFHDAGS
jgi:predicted oxidoreductase (fatty acid repression mutant protein)